MSISDKITYFYIKRMKKWMECPVCHKKLFYNKKQKAWICTSCSYPLPEEEFLDDFVFWFCDGCETYLNVQNGFDRKGTTWICTQCGFNNDITFNNLRGQCKDWGALLLNPDATICHDCKTRRMEKAQIILQTLSDACFEIRDTLSNSTLDDNHQS